MVMALSHVIIIHNSMIRNDTHFGGKFCGCFFPIAFLFDDCLVVLYFVFIIFLGGVLLFLLPLDDVTARRRILFSAGKPTRTLAGEKSSCYRREHLQDKKDAQANSFTLRDNF